MNIKTLWDKVRFFTANLTNNRPLCFLSLMGGIRDFLIGIGFVLGLDEIRQTRLFQNYDELIPHVSGMGVGYILMTIGLIVAVSALADRSAQTKIALRVQSYVWLFSAIMYALHADIILALVFGVFFSIPAGYMAFYYKYAPIWAARKEAFKREWLAEQELDKELEPR